jgi:hypothetical protein
LILLETGVVVLQKTKYLGHIYYYELQKVLDGIQELMKNLWSIIDNPNIVVKEKMKAIKLVLYCYNMRFSLIDCEPLVNDFFNREEKVKSDTDANKLSEEEITRQERALEYHLKNGKHKKKFGKSEIY